MTLAGNQPHLRCFVRYLFTHWASLRPKLENSPDHVRDCCKFYQIFIWHVFRANPIFRLSRSTLRKSVPSGLNKGCATQINVQFVSATKRTSLNSGFSKKRRMKIKWLVTHMIISLTLRADFRRRIKFIIWRKHQEWIISGVKTTRKAMKTSSTLICIKIARVIQPIMEVTFGKPCMMKIAYSIEFTQKVWILRTYALRRLYFTMWYQASTPQ